VNKEIQSIIIRIENVNSGEPWFGQAIHNILEEINTNNVFIKPDKTGHSMIELLYHMITWAEFTLQRIMSDKIKDLAAAEKLDWQQINPKIHTWQKGVDNFKKIHRQIISTINNKEDSFLEEKVDYRTYNFRYLINGMIEHNIYHSGQIAYVNKLLN
jgi:uncharacterized damage-inducible protein DinB